MTRRLLSIASAPGWNARFADARSENGIRAVVLVSWALAEDESGGTAIVGVVQRPGTPEAPTGSLALADEIPGFQGYTFTGLTTKLP